MTGTPTIHVDLDGVLADFELRFLQLTRLRVHHITDDEMWYIIQDYDARGGQWFYDLPVMSGAYELWGYIARYQPKILTATGRAEESAAEQKRRWVQKHFGVSPQDIVTVRKSEMKAQYATPGSILIDDNLDRSIAHWTQAGGIGIHHVNTAMTIAELQHLGL